MKILKSLFAAALALPLLNAPAAAQVPSPEAHVNLNVAEQPLEAVVQLLRDRSGANIVVIEPKEGVIANVTVSVELYDVHWRDALEIVAEKAGCVVEDRPGGILAVVKPPSVDIESTDKSIRDVLGLIAKASGASIALGREVQGNVTVKFINVPWRTALEVTAKSLGYVVVEEKRGVLRVVSPDTLKDQLETRTYQLRYLRPKSQYKPIIKSEFLQAAQQQQQQAGQAKGGGVDYTKTFSVLQALEKALSPQGKLDYVDIANSVIIRDTAHVHGAVKELLARLDVEPAQVFCDVKFVSTTNQDLLNLGVDYGDAGPKASLSGGQVPVTFPFDPGYGGFEDLIITSANAHGPYVDPLMNAGATVVPDTVYGALSFLEFNAVLRLLQRDTKSEVIQAPKLITLDGVDATIFVGETIRYAEAKSEQGQAGGLQLSVAEASGSPVEVGFQLLVRPNVVPGTDKVVMEVIPKETSLSGTGESDLAPAGFDVFTIGASGLEGSIALPRTRSSTIVTSMMLDSGQTMMVGGLSTDQEQKIHTKVPFLGDIPILGWLFSHDSNTTERRSLLVFLTPNVVRSRADTQMILERELKRRRTSLKTQLDELLGSQPATEGAD